MGIDISAYNLSTGNKWVLIIPFKSIDPTLSSDNFSLNLTNFSINDLSIGSTDFGIRGVRIPIPTISRNESKSITFNYMLSSNWRQYRLLYTWFNKIAKEGGGADLNFMSKYMLDCTVYVLSEFKKKLFSITYFGSWISNLAKIDFNYQSDGQQINHNFTLNYAYYEIDDLIEKG